MSKGLALFLVLIFLTSSCIILAKPVSAGTAPVANSWVEKAPMHVARAGLGVAVVNGKIYAIGGATQTVQETFPLMGFSGSGFVGINEQYDPSNGSWCFKTPMPTSRAEFGIVVIGNLIYCIGGITNGVTTAANEVYDTVTDRWTTKAAMPRPGEVQANVISGKIYVVSGDSSYGTNNQVYDPANDSWSSLTTWSYATFRWASTALENKRYVLGGVDLLAGVAYPNEIYNASSNTWSTGSFRPVTIFGGAAAATSGQLALKRIFLIGMLPSLQSPGQPLSPVQIYNPISDNWTIGSPMPTGRSDFGLASINDTFYAVGGYTYAKTHTGQPISPVTPSEANEQYIPAGFGTPDPSYVLEHIPPNISLQSPLSQTYTNSIIFLVFSVDKSVNWVSYSLDGKQNVTISVNGMLTSGAVTNVTIANMTNGPHSLTVYANDTFGNAGTSKTINFTTIKPQTFPTAIIAAVSGAVAVVLVVACLLVYFKKRKR